MNSFKLKYHKGSVLTKALIGVPAIGTIFMLIILFGLPVDTPFWDILVLVAVFLLIMILALIWIIKSQIFVNCQAEIDTSGIKFSIENDSLFYDRKSLYATWENIHAIDEKFSNQNGDYYYALSLNKPRFIVNFSTQENFEEDAEEFFKQLRFYQDNTLSKLQVCKAKN